MFPDDYANFDLLLLDLGDRCQARVVDSPAGQAATEFALPVVESGAPASAQALGQLLYAGAFGGDVGVLLTRSRDQAQATGKGLRIRLRIDPQSPALAALPWEYLYVDGWGTFPALSTQTPLVRYVELDQPERTAPATRPLRILAAIPSPADAAPLPVEKEWMRLQTAVAPLVADGSVVIERLAAPTLGALQDRLRAVDVHVLHFVGHGVFDVRRGEGGLLFENEQRQGQLVPAGQLAALLRDEGLHLVFLAACEGARTGPSDVFGGVATRLVQQAIPAVLAMQLPVSVQAASTLACEFYKAVAGGYPLDAAVAEARKKLYAAGEPREWGIPVLYLRTPEGGIFARPAQQEKAAAAGSWPLRGSLWLGAGLLGIALLAGFGSLLLSDWVEIRTSITIVIGVLASLLGFIGFSGDRRLGQQAAQFAARSRAAQVAISGLLVACVGLWVGVGWPILVADECGPLGCAPPGTQRFAIGEWKNLSPERANSLAWTESTRSVLYDKLGQVDGLQPVLVDARPAAGEAELGLDWWIEGNYQEIDAVQLSAELSGAGGNYQEAVRVRGVVNAEAGGVETQMLLMQDDLAREILSAFGITVTAVLSEAIHATPTDNPEALRLNNQAALLITQGDFAAAQPLLEAAIALDPDYASPHNNLGRMHSLQRNLDAALAQYEMAARLLPRNPTYPFNLGAVHERMGNLDAAVQAYALAIDLDPGYVKAFNNLGFTYLQMGQLQGAQDALERGLELAPEDPYLHKNLGRVRLEAGSAQEAVSALQTALDLSAALEEAARGRLQAEVLYHLALAYRAQNDAAAACAALAQQQGIASEADGEWTAAASTLAGELACH